MSDLKVLIVGASIAGPTAAYWFARAGANVTIIERFPKLRTSGQSIDIRTAGVTIMRKMPGMEAAVRAKTTQQEGVHFVRDDGTPYATMKATGDPNKQSISSEFEIFRGHLAQILFDMTKDDPRIKYVFGEQVASMQQCENEDGPITVEFANGFPTSEYDLVVACDGATSRTRAIGFNCGVRDHIRPLNCWAAYFSIKKDLLQRSKMSELWSTVGGRSMGLGPDPSGINHAGAMGIYPRSAGDDATLPFREALKAGDATLKQYVTDYFENRSWKADEILAGLKESPDFYASEIVQVKTPNLYKGRFVLVGDAGYSPSPLTGAGTTLAIAGAYTLAGEISRHRDDLAAGLAGYETRMRPMITDLQKIPPGMPGLLAPQTVWGIWFRNVILGFITWSGILEVFGGFLAGSLGTDKYGLPDYGL